MSDYTLALRMDHLMFLKQYTQKNALPREDCEVLRFLRLAYAPAKEKAFEKLTPGRRFYAAKRIYAMAKGTVKLDEKDFYGALACIPQDERKSYTALGGIGDSAQFGRLHSAELVLALERRGDDRPQFTRFGIASSMRQPTTSLRLALEEIAGKYGVKAMPYHGGAYTF